MTTLREERKQERKQFIAAVKAIAKKYNFKVVYNRKHEYFYLVWLDTDIVVENSTILIADWQHMTLMGWEVELRDISVCQ